ncbi:polysaccharide pyruvyl transferase family protein [Brucella pituitosa]|uniref:polysaccharide pyruvyl transferase family protein n=1 Tax=Brucella pituitosa TaxID=571256 RepID=UPI003C76C6B9
MKILFYPYHLGYLHTNQQISPVAGLPMSVPYTMEDMEKDLWGVTHNVGNTIHVEAPSRMLEYDTFNSASTYLIDLYRTYGSDPVATAKVISDRFDYLLISEANVFRLHGKDKSESETETQRLKIIADIVDNLTIPFSVIGAGLQSIPSDNLDDFDSNIAYFLRVVDKKSVMLGVRGRATRDWLKRAGISRNVKALGCPSMFLYPKNILGIQYKEINRNSQILTAGYLTPRHIKHRRKRVNISVDIARNFITDFVMQDDYYELSEGQIENHFNEALGILDRDFVLKTLSDLGLDASAIRNFFHFRNSYAWRIKSGQYDAYIGDRLHGGIAAMQAMRPAMIFHDDYRVEELAGLFEFPSASIQSIQKHGVMELITQNYTPHAFDRFKETYSNILNNFRTEMKNAGLKLREPV